MKEYDAIYFWAHMLDEAYDKSYVASDRLRNAKNRKYDEFYTSYENSKKIIDPFAKHLRGKKVLMNVDSPNRSQLYDYIFDNFEKFKIEELKAIGYGDDFMQRVFIDNNGDLEQELIPVKNRGDFTSGESLEAIDWCDVVVGNPPFSKLESHAMNMGAEFFKLPIDHGKDVIGIHAVECVTYGFMKEAVESQILTVYHSPYSDFNVPVDSNGNLSKSDTGKYISKNVNVYIFSTFDDAHELKMKLLPFFNEAKSIGARYEDLPDAPSGPRQDRIDIKVLYYFDTDSYSNLRWIPPKPKGSPISRNLIAISPYQILGCNWQQYFTIDRVARIKGDIMNPITGKARNIDTTFYIFEYK